MPIHRSNCSNTTRTYNVILLMQAVFSIQHLHSFHNEASPAPWLHLLQLPKYSHSDTGTECPTPGGGEQVASIRGLEGTFGGGGEGSHLVSFLSAFVPHTAMQ